MIEISFIYKENDCTNNLYGKIILKKFDNNNEIDVHGLIKPIITNAINLNNEKNLMPLLRKLKIGIIGIITNSLKINYDEVNETIFDIYIICNDNNDIGFLVG